jgi:hypothetical protein
MALLRAASDAASSVKRPTAARWLLLLPFAVLAACGDDGSPPVSSRPAGTGTLTLRDATRDLRVSSCESGGEDHLSMSAIAANDESFWEVTVEHMRSDDAGIHDSVEIQITSGTSGTLGLGTLRAARQGERLFDNDSHGVRSGTVTFTGHFTTTAGRTNVEEEGSIEASCPEEP